MQTLEILVRECLMDKSLKAIEPVFWMRISIVTGWSLLTGFLVDIEGHNWKLLY